MRTFLRTNTWLAAIGLAVAVCATALAQEPVQTTITFLHINDMDTITAGKDGGGIAEVAAVEKAVAAEREHVVLTHGGDIISPSLLSGFDHGAHMIDLLNQLGLDVATLGNHEFDFGPEVALQRIGEAKFAFVSSNVTNKDGSLLGGTVKAKLMQLGGVNVGFFGLTTTDTPVLASPGPDITFADPVAAAAAAATALREAGAHLVIGLSHMDPDDDMAVLAGAPDVDFILSGHNHTIQAFYDGKQGLMEAASQGYYVGVLDVHVTIATGEDGTEEVSWRPELEMISTLGVTPDPAMAAAVARYTDALDKELNVEIGKTAVELDTRRASVRSMETNFGDLIADAMRASVDADVAITNGGGIRGDRTYAAGSTLTRRDVLTELPFGNTVALLRITGAGIRAALEHGVGQFEENAGRFPQVSGLSFTFDPKAPVGSRVSDVKVGDAPLDDNAAYLLATNDYMAGGGDGYDAFRAAEMLIDPAAAELMATAVIDHIAAMGEVTLQAGDRIVQK